MLLFWQRVVPDHTTAAAQAAAGGGPTASRMLQSKAVWVRLLLQHPR